MINALLQIVAPHHCSGCDKTGTLLCQNCKYDIISEAFSLCVACGVNLPGKSGVCVKCHVPYERAWCVGQRHEVLERLINSYKFSHAKSAAETLAELLDDHMPHLPSSVVIVPVPTVNAHIRQRGYDHMDLIAKRFGKLRNLPVNAVLSRATKTKQRDASKRLRVEQAKKAFACRTQLDPDVTYLLIDDVVTTGATLRYAAKTLREQGAQTVWVASMSRQALD